MKGKFAYIVLGTTILLGHLLLAVNLCVSAPDVPYIAFSSKRSGNYDIYMMDINGKNLEQLTDDPADEFDPTFSPDGQRMAYVSNRDGNLEIYVIYLPTKVSHRLTRCGRSQSRYRQAPQIDPPCGEGSGPDVGASKFFFCLSDGQYIHDFVGQTEAACLR